MDTDLASFDEGHNAARIIDSGTRKKKIMTLINTNACSLTPKIESLVDCFEELDVDMAVVKETWLWDGPALTRDLEDLEDGAGLITLTLNRDPHPVMGVSHGGVAFIYKKKIGSFKKIDFHNPEKFEILPVIGTVRGTSRKMVVVSVYIPPNYNIPRGSACLDAVEGLVLEIKAKYRDPYIIVAGDFNQWRIQDSLQEFADISESLVGPTRGD